MMNYSTLNILLGLFIFPLLLHAQELEVNYHHLTEANGLSNNQVFHSLQDTDGFIWLSTKSGLCRYDGYRFENFTVENGIARNDVRKVHLDKKGRLWILTRRELSLRENKKFSVPDSAFEYLRDERVLDIMEDQEGTLWFNGPRTVSYLDIQGNHQQLFLNNPDKRNARPTLGSRPKLLFISPQDELYILYNSQIFIIKDHKTQESIPLTFLEQGPGFPSMALQLSNGEILYTSSQGLARLNNKQEQSLFFTDFPEGFTLDEISQLFQDGNGDIWITHASQGALRLRIQGEGIQSRSLLSGIGINHLMEDAEGDLWFSTEKQGIYLLSRNALQIRNTQSKLKFGELSLASLGEKSFKDLDSYGAGLLHLAEGKFIHEVQKKGEDFQLIRTSEAPFNTSEKVEDVLMLSEKEALIRTEERLFIYQSGNWQELYGFYDPLAMSRNDKGEILITYDLDKTLRLSLEDLYTLMDSQTGEDQLFALEEKRESIPTTEGVMLTQEDPSGIIWGAWINGVYKIVGGEKVSAPKNSPIFNAYVLDLSISSDSLAWFATNGSGIIAIKGEKLSVIDKEKGMQGLVCNALYADRNSGHIWVGTQTGLGRISDYNFALDTFNIKWFDTKDGLHSNEVKKVHRFGEYLWVLGSKGLSLIDDAKIQEESYAPPAYITQLEANNSPEDPSDFYQFTNEKNSIALYFTGISFRNLGKLSFEYNLNDRGWTKVKSNPIRFESLNTGVYNFKIKAKSRDGMSSEVADEVVFEILPAFYETWWFRAAMVFIIGFLLIGLLRYFYSERQRIILEDTVEEKTYELNLKIEELHRSNQDLKQFAYVASHDLKTPLRTVIGHLQLLKIRLGKTLDKDGERAMNFAVESSKSMYEMINHLLDYSRLGKESLEFEEFNLSDILQELEKTLASSIKEKNASIEYGTFPNFQGVPPQWKILFQNLIENAIKFNQSENPSIEISYRDSPDFWILSVRDNGIGIKEEYQPKIFDLFQRLHTHEYPGSGIGLAKCKRIVELHGGSMWIDSVEGEGTDFQFTIAKRFEK